MQNKEEIIKTLRSFECRTVYDKECDRCPLPKCRYRDARNFAIKAVIAYREEHA
jgi:hypothetical protein